MRNRIIPWLLAGAAIVVVGAAFLLLLTMQGSGQPPAGAAPSEATPWLQYVAAGVGGLLLVWLFVGVWIGWPARWAKWMLGWLLAGCFFAVAFFGVRENGHEGTAIALAGLYWMALLFVVGLWLLRLLLSPGLPVFGVARTLLDEAIRMKIPLVFIILLAVLVPILPLVMDPDERLTYQVRSFLTYSLAATGFFLSLMTIFLACATITSEVTRKQIFLTMTKPLGRFQYLLGKWVGIVLLNVLLLSVVMSGIYVFVRVMEAQGAESVTRAVTAKDQRERARELRALREEVLAARASVRPVPGDDFDGQAVFKRRLEQLQAEQPDLFDTESQTLDPELAEDIWSWVIAQSHTISPQNQRSFVFEGLGRAHEYGDTVQLRIKPKLLTKSHDDTVRFLLKANERIYRVGGDATLSYAADTYHFIPIPVQYIEDGRLEVRIANVNIMLDAQTRRPVWASTMTFEPGEGMEILYTVGSFEENLLRGSYVMVIRLAFLAMFALTMGTFTGFPVACLVTLTVYMAAVMSGFLSESLTYFAPLGPREATGWDRVAGAWSSFIEAVTEKGAWETLKVVTRIVAELFTRMVPSFSRYNVRDLLVDGRLVPNRMLTDATLWVGFGWTGASMLIGWLIWRKRELAKVTV